MLMDEGVGSAGSPKRKASPGMWRSGARARRAASATGCRDSVRRPGFVESYAYRGCFICDSPGHMAKDCPRAPGGEACFRCGEPGHFARDCPRPKGTGKGGVAILGCYLCGDFRHFSGECPRAGDDLKHRSWYRARDIREAEDARLAEGDKETSEKKDESEGAWQSYDWNTWEGVPKTEEVDAQGWQRYDRRRWSDWQDEEEDKPKEECAAAGTASGLDRTATSVGVAGMPPGRSGSARGCHQSD